MLREECKGIDKDIVKNLLVRSRSGIKNIHNKQNN